MSVAVRIVRTTDAYNLGYKHGERSSLINCWSFDWPNEFTTEQIVDYKLGYGDARDDYLYSTGAMK